MLIQVTEVKQGMTLTGKFTVEKVSTVDGITTFQGANSDFTTGWEMVHVDVAIGDKVTAVSSRAGASDMFYKGVFMGYTKTGKARIKGWLGIRCYNPYNIRYRSK